MPGGKEVLSGGFVLGCVCCVQGFATYEPGGCCFFPPHLLPRIICCLSQRINNGASGSCTRPSMGWLLLQLLGPSWILHWDDARLYLGRFSPPLMHLESSPPKNFERLVRSAAPEFGEGALGRPYSQNLAPPMRERRAGHRALWATDRGTVKRLRLSCLPTWGCISSWTWEWLSAEHGTETDQGDFPTLWNSGRATVQTAFLSSLDPKEQSWQ